jgi:hypothetical protein
VHARKTRMEPASSFEANISLRNSALPAANQTSEPRIQTRSDVAIGDAGFRERRNVSLMQVGGSFYFLGSGGSLQNSSGQPGCMSCSRSFASFL